MEQQRKVTCCFKILCILGLFKISLYIFGIIIGVDAFGGESYLVRIFAFILKLLLLHLHVVKNDLVL